MIRQPRHEDEGSKRLNNILKRRAARLREPLESLAADDLSNDVAWLATFPVGGDTFAIPLERVRTVKPLKSLTQVPMTESHLLGVIRYMDDVIACMSLFSVLGVRGWEKDPEVLLIVDQGKDDLVAFDCEEVPRSETFPKALVSQAASQSKNGVAQMTTPDLRIINIISSIQDVLSNTGR